MSEYWILGFAQLPHGSLAFVEKKSPFYFFNRIERIIRLKT
jgi:hypothetical protein